MSTHRDQCAVVTYAPNLTRPRWLGAIGHVQGLKFSSAMPGGSAQASWLLQTDPGLRTEALNPGRPVRIFKGASMLWDGNLAEPVPTKDGWLVQAIGVGAQGADFCGYYSTWNLNNPVDQAILRGLRWKNPGIGSGWLLQQPDQASFTITDHMNNITSKQGLTWYVGRDGKLSVKSLPSGANRILVSSDPVPRTLFADVTSIYLKYTASDDGQGNTTYATTVAFNQAAINVHNAHEIYVDLSNAGVMTNAAALAVGNSILAKYGRAGWAGPFVVRYGQLLNMGGQPIDLATEQAGTVARILVTDAPFGGEVKAGAIEFIVGEYEYDDDAQVAAVTPLQSYRNDIGSLLSNFTMS